MKLSAFVDHAHCANCGTDLVDELTSNVLISEGYIYCNDQCKKEFSEKSKINLEGE